MTIPTTYDPRKVESRLYQWWLQEGFFDADPDPSRKPYTIVIPPPNVTGVLTMGHVLNNTYQDLLIRWRRMQGYNVLWIPGTDHAGIATQNVVERELAQEGLTRDQLGREKFIERTWKKARENLQVIRHQLQRLGASCDWRRERFTLDEGLSKAVTEVFVRLYRKGFIYRDRYMVNWCPRCSTALADDEVEHRTVQGHLYWIRYPSEQGEGVIISTTRPETMLGDTAVAVNPNDPRNKHLADTTVILPLMNRPLKIITDERVNPDFGTGCLKVTPAHDPVDFEIGRRHSLEFCVVIGRDGRMTDLAGEYAGLDRFECRKVVLRDLKELRLLVKEEAYEHSVGHCYRCGAVIEPYISIEWFVRMKPLAELAIKSARDGRVRFHPARWTGVYYDWLENVRDWCISRKIWWGHRIPAWHCRDCKRITVDREPPPRCEHCASEEIEQDPDVLDTWFSSWLWPFSTLGWPEETPELGYFYPTSTLISAPDIIFFWVARMIMAGEEFMGKSPFSDVYLHGIVRDEQGRKMSKSLGNSPDVNEVIDRYGADAVRFSIILITAQGQDAFYSHQKMLIGRHFANKIWNAFRLIMLNLEGCGGAEEEYSEADLEFEDRWILSRLSRTAQRVTDSLENFNFNDSARSIYDFFWGDFCDWYLEMIKGRMAEGVPSAFGVACYVLDSALRLLHPFCPFVTEEIWQRLGEKLPERGATSSSKYRPPQTIVLAPWFSGDEQWVSDEVEEQMGRLQSVVRSVRSARRSVGLGERTPLTALLSVETPEEKEFFKRNEHHILKLAFLSSITIDRAIERPRGSLSDVAGGVRVLLPLAGVVDIDKEREKLQKRIQKVREVLRRSSQRLASPHFTTKAPLNVVEKERQKNEELSQELEKLEATLRSLTE